MKKILYIILAMFFILHIVYRVDSNKFSFEKQIITNEKSYIENKISTSQLLEYLGLSKNSLEQEFNFVVDETEGTVANLESHMVFPMGISENLVFVFLSSEMNTLPICIDVRDEVIIVDTGGIEIKNGMSFNEIYEKLYYVEISESWLATENNKVYLLQYEIDDLTFKFISYDEKGEYTDLYIYY